MTALPGIATPSHPLVLGVAEFGTRVDAETAFRLLDRYAEAGGNHCDTAHIYAAWLPGGSGASERLLGRWLRSRGMAKRMIVATKGAHPHLTGDQAPRVRPECIHADLGESLERLGVERVDLYYLHRDDPCVPVEPILAALESARASGRIGAYACSNWSLPRLREAAGLAHARGWAGFSAHQIQWSLADVPAEGAMGTRAMDPALRAWHRATGVPVAAYSSQAVGFFAREWAWPSGELRERKFARYLSEANVRRAWRVRARAAAHGVSPNQLALAWLLRQPQPVLAVLGCKTRAHLEDSLGSLRIALSPAELADLERGA